jgi:cell division protein FtsQ
MVGLVVAAALLGGGWLWFQDSSLVAVEHVEVTGPSGPDGGAIRAALDSAARSMSTLDVQTNRLYAAVSAFPVVKKLEVSTQFPHGMRIHVIEQLPVAEVAFGGARVGVAADGTVLHDLARLPTLPRIHVAVPPGGPRLTEPAALSALAAANAAPRALLLRISLIFTSAQHGLVAQLRDGPAVYLGAADDLAAKWSALVAVLADSASAGASYIDVTDPDRPAAGVDATAASALAGSGGSTAVGTSPATSAGLG